MKMLDPQSNLNASHSHIIRNQSVVACDQPQIRAQSGFSKIEPSRPIFTASADQNVKCSSVNSVMSNSYSYWYHGNISREDTERLLKHQPANGTFLIRYSISTGKYVLSVIFNQQIFHYPIEELPDGFYQVNGTNSKYLGIDLLVAEFRRTNNCIVCSLSRPIRGTRPPSHVTVYGSTNELHHAVRKANFKGVRELLNKVSERDLIIYINEKSADSGATPLIEASKTGSNDIVRLLLEKNAEVNLRDCGGFTALHRACQKSFAHVAETLLRQGRANPQIKCPFSGNTALHEASMLGHSDCVNCLLRFFAAPWSRNLEGEMPFELALRYGFTELATGLAAYKPPKPVSTQEDWYHPSLNKNDTERFLTTHCPNQDGAFLLRRSSQSDRKLVLVLIYHRQSLKYQIEIVDFSFHSDSKEAYFIDKGPLHLSLEHLVEHYSRFADGIPTRLRFAVSSKGRILDTERLLPPGSEQLNKELIKISTTASGWKLGAEDVVKALVRANRNHNLSSNNPPRLSSSSSSGVWSQMANNNSEIRMIPSDAVILLYRLGEGEFGEVYRGRLHLDNGQIEEVAVKVLVQPSQRLDFMKEASIMMQLSHPNIITMYGVCENKRLMMILEVANLGSLLDYLLDYPEKIQLGDLHNWAMQIASGMTYLESKGFVHRDLACRNVLLSNENCCKISDFGLSRAVGVESDYYKATRRGKWPVKWYAPESIYYKTFSHASDVWSYGVCLWEMWSLGEHPYAQQDSFEVLRQIEEGVRLPRPKLTSDKVYMLMQQCWAYRPEDRPTFSHLLAVFSHLCTNIYENVDPPDH